MCLNFQNRATSEIDKIKKHATRVFELKQGNVAGYERKAKTHKLQRIEETNRIYLRIIVETHTFSQPIEANEAKELAEGCSLIAG